MQWCRRFVGLVVVSLLPAAGFAQVVIGPGAGGTTPIQFIEPTGTRTLDAFPGFLGGMSVTLGDVNGDGVADVIAGAGPGGGPHVRVFSGIDLTELANFYAFDPAFGGGVRVAAGDVDGDGLADIIAGAGPGGGPHVRVFSGGNLSELASFYAYDPTFAGGVTVAAGDVDGDGRADIVTGAGAGGGPHVRVLSGLDLSELASFYAYDPAFEGGVFVAAGDIDGDGLSDVVAGVGPGGGPHVRVFSGLDLGELASFYAYDPAFEGGVLVATGDIDGDGRVDLIFGALDQQVRILSGVDLSELASFFAPPGMGEGISVGSSGDSVGLRFTSPATTTFSVGSAGTFTVTTEGGPGMVTLSATGTLPSGVTFTDASDGTATLSGTPAAGAAGTYPLTITATHGTRTVTQVFTLTVSAAANQPPRFTAGPNQIVAEDAGPQSVANWATAISAGPAHEASQALTFIVMANSNLPLFSGPPAVSSTGTLNYTAAPGAFGSADITIVLRDNGGTANGGIDTSAPHTFTITVTPVNDPPSAVADSYTVEEGGTVSVVAPGVLSNDVDPDTPAASRIATLVTGPANAVFFRLNTDGSFTYVHDGSETSTDSFTYRMNDGTTDSNVATVTLTVTNLDDPLETEPNGSANTATGLTGSLVKITGNIFPAGDVDYYAFTAQAGDRVYAATMTQVSASGSVDSSLALLATDGSTVLESDLDNGTFGTTSSSIAGATIPVSGTYFLRVSHNSPTITLRPYDLWVRVRSGAPTAETEANDTIPGQPLPASGWVSGALSSATDVDYYAVTLNAGDSVMASLDLDPERDGVEWNGLLALAPFGDAPGILPINDAGAGTPDSEAHFVTVKDAGTYYVVVSAPSGGTFGTYQLSVSVLPASTTPRTTYTSTNVPVTIPTGPAIVSSTIAIPDDIRIGQLKVAIDLTHNFMADLDVTLTSPDGNTVALFTDIGSTSVGAQTRMNLILDDTAAIPSVFPAVSGLVLKPELNFRLEWFKGQQAQGTWTLTIRDDATGDGGTLNSWSLIVVEEEPLPVGTPRTIFSTDFESGDGGFTHSGTQDEWEWGAPASAPITTANSGVNAWKTDLDGTYNASSSQDLFSPEIDLTGVTSGSVLLEWAMKFQMEGATFDHAFVEVQEVGGGGRTRKLWEWLGADMTVSVGNPATTLQESAGWGRYRALVNDFFGKRIRLRFHLDSDNTVQLGGLAIDDVSVTAFER